jgi:hypothetical protein
MLDSAANHAVEWEHLAACYDRLAEQAERNERFDLIYEPILRPDGGLEGESKTGTDFLDALLK